MEVFNVGENAGGHVWVFADTFGAGGGGGGIVEGCHALCLGVVGGGGTAEGCHALRLGVVASWYACW